MALSRDTPTEASHHPFGDNNLKLHTQEHTREHMQEAVKTHSTGTAENTEPQTKEEPAMAPSSAFPISVP